MDNEVDFYRLMLHLHNNYHSKWGDFFHFPTIIKV